MVDGTKEERKISVKISVLEGTLENVTLGPVYKLILRSMFNS